MTLDTNEATATIRRLSTMLDEELGFCRLSDMRQTLDTKALDVQSINICHGTVVDVTVDSDSVYVQYEATSGEVLDTYDLMVSSKYDLPETIDACLAVVELAKELVNEVTVLESKMKQAEEKIQQQLSFLSGDFKEKIRLASHTIQNSTTVREAMDEVLRHHFGLPPTVSIPDYSGDNNAGS